MKKQTKKPKRNWKEVMLFIVGLIFGGGGLAFVLIKVVYPFLK